MDVHAPKDGLKRICQRYHIRRLSLFGSALRDDFGPDSDVDVLVEFEEGYVPGFIRLAAIERELSALFGGRPVDLHTPRGLSRYFRDHVLDTAQVQYAKS
ncbi:MAG: nucleotidyltransferase [Bacteroidetes bacterium]|jgi:predicted nucleotidyltransferase|nr:nucleotidyltransferase [Bacteroidota bacterium]